MADDLERLYQDAKAALKARNFDRASDLLRQILIVDETYKDASRLLAQSVRLKRRRWHNDRRLWSVVGMIALIGICVLFAPRLPGLYADDVATPTNITTTPSVPTSTATAAPTAIPLAWKRISLGQEFQRDTVTTFATDKKDPDVIYAAMKNAGVYKTIDGGLSWRPAHQGLASTQVESLLIDSQNPHILYASTMGGVFKTEDGSENWFKVGDGTYLLMDTKDNSHLYARDENGIYETLDQGSTWKTVYALKKDCPDVISSWAIHPTNGNMLFIGGMETCAGVFQSTDNAHTWTLIGMEDKPNIANLAIGLDEHGNFSVYVTFISPILPEERTGLYVSHDGGANWSRTGYFGCNFWVADSDNPSEIYCDINVKPPNIPSIGFWASHIDHPNGKDRIIASVINPANDDNDISILISTDDGMSWAERDDGLGLARAELKIDPTNSAKMYVGAYYPRGLGWFYEKMQKELTDCTLYRSVDSGTSWSSTIKYTNWCGPAFDGTDAFYLIQRGSLQKSWDGGERWLWMWNQGGNEDAKRIANTLPNWAPQEGSAFQSVSANPYVDGLLYAAGDMVYYSTDAGLSWQLSTGSEGSWDARLFYTEHGTMIYAIGRYHQSYSVDSGKAWQSCGEGVTTSRSDSRLATDLQSSRLYLATPGNGVLISNDNCHSWQASNEGLSNHFVNTLAVDPNNSNTVYAGTDGGVYVSFNAGRAWGQINDGLLGATVVYSIAVDKDSNVYAATPYGIFKLEGK